MFKYVFVIVLIFPLSLLGQDSSSDTTDYFTGKTLIFQVNGLSNLRLEKFSGGLGMITKFRKDIKWRRGVGIEFHKSDNYFGEKTSYEYRSMSVIDDFIYYFRKRENIRPYWGIGFSAGISETYVINQVESVFYDRRATREIFGTARGFMGLEYFYSNMISFSAEYLVDGYFGYSENKRRYVDYSDDYWETQDYIRRTYKINMNTVSIIMAVYL